MINENNIHILSLIIINIFLYLPYPLSIIFNYKLNENDKIIINQLLLQLSIYYLILTVGILYYIIYDLYITNNDGSSNELIDDYPIFNISNIIIFILIIIIVYLQIKLTKNQYNILK